MNRVDAEQLTWDLIVRHGLDDAGWKPAFIGAKNIHGQCAFGPKEIRLSTNYVELNERDHVEQTILHEIAHALHGPVYRHGIEKAHGPRWRKIAREIGVKRPASTQEANVVECRYFATCPTCGKTVAERHLIIRKMRNATSRCHHATVVWHDRQTGAVKPLPTAALRPAMRDLDVIDLTYAEMSPGRKAAYTKRMRAIDPQWKP